MNTLFFLSDASEVQLPFAKIAGLVVSLVIPLAIGALIQIYKPNIAVLMKKLLKPMALVFIIFAIGFGLYTNFYIFYFFTWQVR